MKKKKILFAITDAGNAHKVASEALIETFEKLYPKIYTFKIIDFLKEADVEPFNTSDTSYSLVSRNTFLDSLNIFISNLFNSDIIYPIFRNYVLSRLYDPFLQLIKKEKPEIVISNHPITTLVIDEIRRREGGFKFVVNVLDLVTFFRGLSSRNADLSTTPNIEILNQLIKLGVEKNKIISNLFPLHPKLLILRKRKEVVKELGFKDDKKIILITGGGSGLNTLREGIKKIIESNKYQIIIVTGKLNLLKEELDRTYIDNKNIVVLGFVNNMQDLINISDLVISKPGATTIMELEFFGKKAIFTKRVGHVEQGHEEYIRKNKNFKYIGDNWGVIEKTIEELLNSEVNESIDRKRDLKETERIVKEIAKL